MTLGPNTSIWMPNIMGDGGIFWFLVIASPACCSRSLSHFHYQCSSIRSTHKYEVHVFNDNKKKIVCIIYAMYINFSTILQRSSLNITYFDSFILSCWLPFLCVSFLLFFALLLSRAVAHFCLLRFKEFYAMFVCVCVCECVCAVRKQFKCCVDVFDLRASVRDWWDFESVSFFSPEQ